MNGGLKASVYRSTADLLDRLLALGTSQVKLGLDTITRLSAALGHPERSFTSVHVAGTNGKGSVTAMVHAALVAAGVRAARYTSPHLVDLAERFVIGAEPVDARDLARVAGEVLDCADRLKARGELSTYPTFFEATTAIGFELFRRARVDVAVIEVGLGGRFDATNIVSPPAGAITSIGFDHQQYLGDTLEAIAFEKAGIIKPGMEVVVGALPDVARTVVADVAAERGARVIDAARDAQVHGDLHKGRATLVIETPDARYGPLSLALRGTHQIGNALVAVRLLEAARRAGIRLPGEAIERGLTGVDWPARLESIELPDGTRVVLDAAHNVDGAQALAAYLGRWHPERPALVIGIMGDKDADGMIDALLPVVSSVITTDATTARAMAPHELADRVRARRADCGFRLKPEATWDVRTEPNALRAVEQALTLSDTVCVAGSIFLAGAVRDALRRRAILR